MRKKREAVRRAVCLAAMMLLAMPAFASSADKRGHGDMEGMQGMQGMKMGDRIYSGKIGPWTGDARIMDMKASMEASGMKSHGAMTNSHHISIVLTDPKTKAPLAEGKGTVTVNGPDKGKATAGLMAMQGHFGADINLPKPGKYLLEVVFESGGGKGSASFSYTVK